MQNTEITTCPRHPKVETELRCASCGELICSQCMVITPVGAKCRDCGTSKGSRQFSLTPFQTVSAVGVGLLMGAVAGWAVEYYLGIFFTLFLSFAYGGFAGEMIMRASGRKRGVRMEIIAGVTLVAGALLGRVIVAATLLAIPGQAHPEMGLLQVIYDLIAPSPIPIIALGVIVVSAVSRMRYL